MNMVVHAKDPQVLQDFIKAQVLTRMLFEGKKKETQKPDWDVDPDSADEGVKPYVPKIAPHSTSVPPPPFHAARAELLDLSISGGNQVKEWEKAMENAMENSARHVAAMNEGSSAKTLSTPTSTMANRSVDDDDEESDSWTTAKRMEYLVNSMADQSIEDFAENDEQTSEHDVGIVAPSESDKVEPMVTGAAVEHPVTDIASATAGDKFMAPSAAPAALVPKSATLRELMGTVKRLLISSRSKYNFEDVTYIFDFERAVEIIGANQFCRLPGSTRDVLRPGSIFNKGAAKAGLPAGIHRWLQGSPEATQTFRYPESVINKTIQQLTRLGMYIRAHSVSFVDRAQV
jgi:hypothetical protein